MSNRRPITDREAYLRCPQIQDEDCPFCRFSEGEIVGTVRIVVPTDGMPDSIMILPLEHRERLWDLTPDEIADTIVAAERSWSRWNNTSHVDANLIWNLGSLAGQTVPHLHAHLIPRDGSDALPGYGARWWLKRDLRRAWLLRLVAQANPQSSWRR